MYATACVIFEMIAARPPFIGDTPGAIIAQQINDPPPDLREFVPYVPVRTSLAVNRALTKNPSDRFETCSAFAKEV